MNITILNKKNALDKGYTCVYNTHIYYLCETLVRQNVFSKSISRINSVKGLIGISEKSLCFLSTNLFGELIRLTNNFFGENEIWFTQSRFIKN